MDAEEFIAGVIRDLETSGLTEKEKALFRFVDRVNQLLNQHLTAGHRNFERGGLGR